MKKLRMTLATSMLLFLNLKYHIMLILLKALMGWIKMPQDAQVVKVFIIF